LNLTKLALDLHYGEPGPGFDDAALKFVVKYPKPNLRHVEPAVCF